MLRILRPLAAPDPATDDAWFFIDSDRCAHTYGVVRARVVEARAALQATGRDELALECSNTIDFVVAFVAAALELRHLSLIGKGEASALRACLGREMAMLDEEAQRRLALPAGGGTIGVPAPRLERLSYFTSGTTGSKKLLALAPATLLQRLVDWTHDFVLPLRPTFLCTTTFAHSHGLNLHLLPAIHLHGTLIAPRLDLLTTGGLFRLIEFRRPDLFSAMPQLLRLLVTARGGCPSLAGVRLISGSDRLDADVKQDFEARFGCALYDQFGCAETGPVHLLRHANGRRYLGQTMTGRRVAFSTDEDGLIRMSVESRSLCDEIWQDGTRQALRSPYELADRCGRDAEGLYLAGRRSLLHVLPDGDTVDFVAVEHLIEQRFDCPAVVVPADASSGSHAVCVYVGRPELAQEIEVFSAHTWTGLRLDTRSVEALATTNLGKKVRTLEPYGA